MAEQIKELQPAIKKASRWLGISAAALAFIGAGTESASAQTTPNHKKPSSLVVAERAIKQEIVHRKPVHLDAIHNAYWPANKLTRLTSVPVVASVRGILRYFELDQEGDSLNSIAVRALPLKPGLVQSKWDGLYHNGELPNHTGTVTLGKRSVPSTELVYPDGTHFQVAIGHTEPNNGTVLLPPLICTYTPGKPAVCTS
jgi:hypothetical protein